MKYAKCDINILVQSNNVGKGSRQNGSVTSGEGLAPRAGSVGLPGSVRSRSGLAERGRTVSSRSRGGGWHVPAKPDRGRRCVDGHS